MFFFFFFLASLQGVGGCTATLFSVGAEKSLAAGGFFSGFWGPPSRGGCSSARAYRENFGHTSPAPGDPETDPSLFFFCS